MIGVSTLNFESFDDCPYLVIRFEYDIFFMD